MIGLLKRFIKEEEAQVSLEWFLVLGAAIVAAVMFASSYRKMAYSSEMQYIAEIHDTYDELCSYVETTLESEFEVCG